MSSTDPPSFTTSIFNASAFVDTSEVLTLGDANSKYLSKSNPSGAGTLKIGQILVGSSTDNASSRLISALDSTLTVGQSNFVCFGKSASAGNQAELSFYNAGDNLDANRLDFGFFGGVRMSLTKGGFLGIGTSTPSNQLTLSTDSAAKPSTNTWTVSSDQRVKEDIEDADIDICYDNVKNLKLKYFKWKDDFIDDHSIEDRHKLGWIAQEVETVLPKAVTTTNNDKYEIEDFKSLNSDQIIACMYGAIQKLIEKVESL